MVFEFPCLKKILAFENQNIKQVMILLMGWPNRNHSLLYHSERIVKAHHARKFSLPTPRLPNTSARSLFHLSCVYFPICWRQTVRYIGFVAFSATERTISITAPFERNYAFRPVPDSRRVASATKRTGELQNRKVSLPGEGRSIKAEIAARGRRSSYSSRGRIVNEPDLSHRHVYTKGKLLPIEEKREKYEMWR